MEAAQRNSIRKITVKFYSTAVTVYFGVGLRVIQMSSILVFDFFCLILTDYSSADIKKSP